MKQMTAAGLCVLLLGFSSFRLLSPLFAEAYDSRIPDYAAEILTQQSGGDVQQWLTGTLPSMAGLSSPDWYCMALSAQGGYDLSAYAAALETYIITEDEPSATSRERLALSLLSCTSDMPAVCTDLLDRSAGQQGIMSWIFALHLLNNGVPSQQFTAESVVAELLAVQCADGGWSLPGTYGDPDVTAMTMQALAPNAGNGNVSAALERGVQFLSEKQLVSGAYQSYGTENPESTAQVWVSLCCMGIDPLSDSRFIKEGHTLLDGILQFRIAAGQYAHLAGGSYSAMATVQTFLALTAADLQQNGKSPLFLYRTASQPAVTEPPVTEPHAQTRTPVQTRTPAQTRTPSRTTARAATTAPADSGDARQTDAAAVTGAPSAANGSAAAQSRSTTAVSGTKRTTAAGTTVSGETKTHAVTKKTAVADMQTEATSETVTAVTEPEVIHTTAPPADTRTDREKYPYRIPMTAGAAVLFGGAALFFFLRKNRSVKTYLTLAGGLAAVTVLIWVIKVESPEQFYQNAERTGGGTVTMAIRCDVILGMDGSEKYPADGEIMPLTEFAITENENALELLYDAVKAYQLQIEVDGVSGDVVETAYVRGIASLYEFDFGDLSGWTYTVNGERPDVGCGAYTLHDGDRVVWAYTVNL